MISKKLLSIPVLVAVAIFGIAIGSAFMAKAQSVATNTNTPAIVTNSSNSLESAVDTPESVNDPADTDTGVKAHQHAPLGGDGIVASITGSTVVISEESDE